MVNTVNIDQTSDDAYGENKLQDTMQFLTFLMAQEEYGIDILRVQEIRGWETATTLPNVPAHIKGVVNLRGTIVPLVDLRHCFGLPEVKYSAETVVIVLLIKTDKGDRVVGIVVDAVSDVFTLAESEVCAAPELADSVEINFIRGLATVNEKMVILLDIDKLRLLDEIPDQMACDIKNQLNAQRQE